MNTTSHKSDISIIAALFVLLLIYCTVCLKPTASDVKANNDTSVALTANKEVTVRLK